VALLYQVISLLAYTPIISLTNGEATSLFMPLAVLLNTVTVGFLIVAYINACRRPPAEASAPIRQLFVLASASCVAMAVWFGVAVLWGSLEPRMCPANEWLDFFCTRKLPANLNDTTPKHWVLFGGLLAASYGACRLLLTHRGPR
jgi:hypothetical protein